MGYEADSYVRIAAVAGGESMKVSIELDDKDWSKIERVIGDERLRQKGYAATETNSETAFWHIGQIEVFGRIKQSLSSQRKATRAAGRA